MEKRRRRCMCCMGHGISCSNKLVNGINFQGNNQESASMTRLEEDCWLYSIFEWLHLSLSFYVPLDEMQVWVKTQCRAEWKRVPSVVYHSWREGICLLSLFLFCLLFRKRWANISGHPFDLKKIHEEEKVTLFSPPFPAVSCNPSLRSLEGPRGWSVCWEQKNP